MVSCNFHEFYENKQSQDSLILEKFDSVCRQIAENDDSVEAFFQEVVLPILEAGQVANSEELLDVICEDAVDRYLQSRGRQRHDPASDYFGQMQGKPAAPSPEAQLSNIGADADKGFDARLQQAKKRDMFDKAGNFAAAVPGYAKQAGAALGAAGKKAYEMGKSGLGAAKQMFTPAASGEAAPNYSPAQQQAVDVMAKKLPEIKQTFIKHIDSIAQNVMSSALGSAGKDKLGSRISWIAAKTLGGQLKNAIQNWNPKTQFSANSTGFSSALQQQQGEDANVNRRVAQMGNTAGYDAFKDPANVHGRAPKPASTAGQTPAVPAQAPIKPAEAGRKSPILIPRDRTDMKGRYAVKGIDYMRRR